MKEPQSDLAWDLKALQYTDALDAGDLETVAALWDEASRDPRLRRILTEIDGVLFVDEAGRIRRPEAGATRSPIRRRWAIALCGAAAAGVLAYFVGVAFVRKKPGSIPVSNERPHIVVAPPREDDAGITEWQRYRQALDGEDVPAFTWPVQGDVAELGIRLDPSDSARPRDQSL